MKDNINNIGYFKHLDSIMIEIIEDGEHTVYANIENIKNPITRHGIRELYVQAIKKLKRNL